MRVAKKQGQKQGRPTPGALEALYTTKTLPVQFSFCPPPRNSYDENTNIIMTILYVKVKYMYLSDSIYVSLQYAKMIYMTKIAIIEDDPVINQMYRMKFEADGFEVELADNGSRGVALVETFQPDLILLDMQMPKMNGAEALTEIRKHDWGKHIPVIILTNLGEEESPQSLKSLGIHSYIVKADLTPSQVVSRVKEALNAKN